MFKCFSLLSWLFLFSNTFLISDEGIALPDDYKKNSGVQWKWAIEGLEKFPFNPQDSVLDVGSGDGKISALISEWVPEGYVIGLDISEKMINYASSQFQKDNLSFIQGNATDIPFKNQFDKLVSFCTLQWVLDQEKALQSIKDCLKVGGVMLLVIPGQAYCNSSNIAEEVAHSPKWASFFPNFKQARVFYTGEEYRRLLEKANLYVQSIEEQKGFSNYPDKLALMSWLKPIVNYIDHLKPELQNDFLEDMAELIVQKSSISSDGSICVQHVKLEIIATNSP